LNIFITSVYGAEKDGSWTHFESVFLLNGWVGWLVFRELIADMNWLFCISIWNIQHS